MSDLIPRSRREDLLEIVGTHGWQAVKNEAEEFLRPFLSRLLIPAKDQFDFIRKEVDAGVVREVRRFLAFIEELAEQEARKADSSDPLDKD